MTPVTGQKRPSGGISRWSGGICGRSIRAHVLTSEDFYLEDVMKCRVAFSVVSLVALSLILASCGGGSPPATTEIAYVAHSQSHSPSVINIPADKTVASIEIGNSSVAL